MIGIKELLDAVMTKKLAFVDRFLVVFPVWSAVLVSLKSVVVIFANKLFNFGSVIFEHKLYNLGSMLLISCLFLQIYS